MEQSYTIKLAHFEGPFDLLLFFIERDELDIYNIPIAKITDDFLEYIRAMQSLSIDLASEFMLVAATLMKIKSKMLLPRKEIDEEGNEVDPRDELIRRLVEYKRYKSVLHEMALLEESRGVKVDRGNRFEELQRIANRAMIDSELESLSLFKLLKAFEGVMNNLKERSQRRVHEVVRYNYTMERQREFILSIANSNDKVFFERIFEYCENKMHAIFNFLALLELVHGEFLRITIGEGFNNFWVEKIN